MYSFKSHTMNYDNVEDAADVWSQCLILVHSVIVLKHWDLGYNMIAKYLFSDVMIYREKCGT